MDSERADKKSCSNDGMHELHYQDFDILNYWVCNGIEMENNSVKRQEKICALLCVKM